jgi:hypothetical protein
LCTTYSLSLGKPLESRHVVVWKQPAHRWLVSRLYHAYDSVVWRLPGFRALENWLRRRHADDAWYVPLSSRQDLRCDYLWSRKRTVLAVLDASEEQFTELARPS